MLAIGEMEQPLQILRANRRREAHHTLWTDLAPNPSQEPLGRCQTRPNPSKLRCPPLAKTHEASA